MPRQDAAPYTVVVTRPHGRMDHAAATPAQVCTILARLAPLVPHDATWEVHPCPAANR